MSFINLFVQLRVKRNIFTNIRNLITWKTACHKKEEKRVKKRATLSHDILVKDGATDFRDESFFRMYRQHS